MCLYYLRMSCLYPHKSFIYINKATILAFSGCFYRRIFCCHQGVVVKLVFKIFYYVWNLSFKFSVNLCLVCLLTLLFIDSFIPLNPFAYILFLIFIYLLFIHFCLTILPTCNSMGSKANCSNKLLGTSTFSSTTSPMC